MGASATRIRERQTAPVARAEVVRAELRRSVEPSRFERRVSHAVQPGVQRSSHAAIARISSLSQLRPQRATRITEIAVADVVQQRQQFVHLLGGSGRT